MVSFDHRKKSVENIPSREQSLPHEAPWHETLHSIKTETVSAKRTGPQLDVIVSSDRPSKFVETLSERINTPSIRQPTASHSSKKFEELLTEALLKGERKRDIKVREGDSLLDLTVFAQPEGCKILVRHIWSRNGVPITQELLDGIGNSLKEYASTKGKPVRVELVAYNVMNKKLENLLVRMGFEPRPLNRTERSTFEVIRDLSLGSMAAAGLLIPSSNLLMAALIGGFVGGLLSRKHLGITFVVKPPFASNETQKTNPSRS